MAKGLFFGATKGTSHKTNNLFVLNKRLMLEKVIEAKYRLKLLWGIQKAILQGLQNTSSLTSNERISNLKNCLLNKL